MNIMKTPQTCRPIWIISFNPVSNKETIRERAVFSIPLPQLSDLSEKERLALSFIEQIGEAFKKMDNSSSQTEPNYKSIEEWIKWLKELNGENPDPEK